jgi:hypothetical protein
VLKQSWPARGWSWDRRFECIASTIAVEFRDEAWRAARAQLPTVWTERTLPEAPKEVLTVAEATGGVRSDQFLLCTELVDGMLLYGLWWPWGGEGTNISMRVGVSGWVTYDDHEALRNAFNVVED